MALTGKFVYMAHHFILLLLDPFDLAVDRKGWWFEHPSVIVAGLLVNRGCSKRFLLQVISTPRMG